MSNVVITITKSSINEPWLILTKDFIKENFNADEINNIIIPYTNFKEHLPGFLATNITYPNELTMVIKHSFDTLDNATNALSFFKPPYETDSLSDLSLIHI